MPGRITKRILDETLEELDSGRLQRLIRTMRYRAEKASRTSYNLLKAESPNPNSAALPAERPGVKTAVELVSESLKTQLTVEETVSRLMQRYQQIDGAAEALLTKAVSDEKSSRQHTLVIIKNVADRDTAEQATEPSIRIDSA